MSALPLYRKLSDSDLKPLFEPRSVAVVGVSADASKPASRAVRFLVQSGIKVYAIGSGSFHPPGATTLTSLEQLPEPVDVCVIAVRPDAVLALAKTAHAKGVRSLVIFSSGFGEGGPEGKRLESELRHFCNRNGMTVLGPNSLGILNMTGQASITFASAHEDGDLLPGNIAFVTQSGAVATIAGRIAGRAMLGFSHIVSTGNETCLSSSQLGLHLLKRPEVDQLAIYVEDSRHIGQLLELVHCGKTQGKPVVTLTGGLTTQGRSAAASHTGSMSGDMAVIRSLLQAEGAIAVQSPHELVVTLTALGARTRVHARSAGATHPLRVAIITGSGGMGVMLSDLLAQDGLELAQLADTTVRELGTILPTHASLGNPIDVTATVNLNPAPLTATVRCAASDKNVDVLILLASGGSQRIIDATVKAAEAAATAQKDSAPLFIVWPCAPAEGLRALAQFKTFVFERIEDVSHGLRQLQTCIRAMDETAPTPAAGKPARTNPAVRTPRSDQHLPRENNLKTDMQSFGISIPEHAIATSREEAVIAACRIGFPVVLKLVAPAVSHKTEIDAVCLNLHNAQATSQAFDRMQASLVNRFPGVSLEFMVEGMVNTGVELVVSVSRNQDGVDVLMLGSGGIAVESERDVTFCRAPASRVDFERALAKTRVGRFLTSKRGQNFDMEALLDFNDKLNRFFYDGPYSFQELELNPVRVLAHGHGAFVLDATSILMTNQPAVV